MVTLLQRVRRRWDWLRGRNRLRYFAVRAPRLVDHEVHCNGLTLYASGFNPAWFGEFGIVPKVIVDVGSFDGGDAVKFHQAFPSARVVTIEADPVRAEAVRRAVAGTGIELIECAVCEADRPVAFYPTTIAGERSSQGSLLRIQPGSAASNNIEQSEAPVTVQGRALGSLLAGLGLPNVDLLQMDIQGAELMALRGLGEIRPALIYLEVGAAYDGAPDPAAVHRHLRNTGYRLAADLITDRLYYRPVPGAHRR